MVLKGLFLRFEVQIWDVMQNSSKNPTCLDSDKRTALDFMPNNPFIRKYYQNSSDVTLLNIFVNHVTFFEWCIWLNLTLPVCVVRRRLTRTPSPMISRKEKLRIKVSFIVKNVQMRKDMDHTIRECSRGFESLSRMMRTSNSESWNQKHQPINTVKRHGQIRIKYILPIHRTKSWSLKLSPQNVEWPCIDIFLVQSKSVQMGVGSD